jgi:hypothetical protein
MQKNTSEIYGLIVKCPLGQTENSKYCVLNKIWKSELRRGFDFVKSLSTEEVNELIDYHDKKLCENHFGKNISEELERKINVFYQQVSN